MGKKLINCLFVFWMLSYNLVYAQTGGRSVFQFLELSPSPRLTATGENAVAWQSIDAANAWRNPSLLNEKQHTQVLANQQKFFDGINAGDFSYSHYLRKYCIMTQAGFHYYQTGDLVRTDAFGDNKGTFYGLESSTYISAAKKINERITYGLTINYINSKLDNYNSSGLSINTGVHYFNPIKNMGISLSLRNAGIQLTQYDNTKSASLPLVIELGLSKRLKHLPLIYHLNFKNLEKWNQRYDNPADRQSSDLFDQNTEASTFDKLLGNAIRHFGFGFELYLSKKENFILRGGYNPLRSKDLSLVDYRAFTGICAGFGLKIYKFRFDYGYARYHLSGGTHHFGFSTNINSFLKHEI